MNYYIGVDVGTGSVRAALVQKDGKVKNVAVENIKTWNPQPDFYEQSSDNIWESCKKVIKEIVQDVDPKNIKGIGFDATCSLVVLNKDMEPLSVSLTGSNEQNVVLWMDHRAAKEANLINQANHPVLRFVGGKVSLEMEIPKLMWLKNNLHNECWRKAGAFFDLPDFLTWRATGCDVRSLCSLVCKWNYEIKSDGSGQWNKEFLQQIGLEDLIEDNFKKIGTVILSPGTPVANGLSKTAAKELGLTPGTPVGTSLIDAHAGGLGMIGCRAEGIVEEFHSKIGLICGTSTCHMAVSAEPVLCPGVWGPYYSAMVPNMWLNEGGQSATGKLLDFIIENHPATISIKEKLKESHIHGYLNVLLKEMAQKQNLPSVNFLTNELHVWPDFHGNRSPLADPTLKGMISGLTLSNNEENLALIYLATVQALSYGTKFIIESLIKSGHSAIKTILICGGLSKNLLFTQVQADVVNLPVVCPNEPESVLLGSAILGACAAGSFPDIKTAIQSMGGTGKVVRPNNTTKEFHEKKYKVFLKMLEDQESYRNIMESSSLQF